MVVWKKTSTGIPVEKRKGKPYFSVLGFSELLIPEVSPHAQEPYC